MIIHQPCSVDCMLAFLVGNRVVIVTQCQGALQTFRSTGNNDFFITLIIVSSSAAIAIILFREPSTWMGHRQAGIGILSIVEDLFEDFIVIIIAIPATKLAQIP